MDFNGNIPIKMIIKDVGRNVDGQFDKKKLEKIEINSREHYLAKN